MSGTQAGKSARISIYWSNELLGTVANRIGMENVVGYRIGVPGVVRELCQQIGLVDVVDEATEWHKQAKMSPGQRILALILCIFTDRHALWRIEEFYQLC